MLIKTKLYGGMVCNNPQLPCFRLNKFELELPGGSSLQDLYNILELGRANLVNIVDGKAQGKDYVLDSDCNVSIFLPMSDRQQDFLGKIKETSK